MSARHALVRPPIRVRLRPILAAAADIADVLWMVVCAAFWSLVAAVVFGLIAFGLAQNGQWAGGVIVIGVGFALIILVLIVWAGRQTMQKPQPGNECCPWCGQPALRLTTEVKGHPRPGLLTLVDAKGIKVCGACAPAVIDTALREHNFSSPPVEVLPIKTMPLQVVSDWTPEERAEVDRELMEDRTRDAAGLE